MIDKQQALEFIYDLSQKTEIMLDVSCGEMQFNRIVDGDYLYTSFAGESTLEATVTKCIKEHMDAIMNYVDKIPVDVDMLEVGQTYKVHIQEDWEHRYFTAKFLGFDEEDEYVVKFENNKPCTKFDFREIYKVPNENNNRNI